MQQLTGLDASWLYLETPSTPLHVGVINVFDASDDPDFSPLDAARTQFASRVPLIDPLRRRLVEVPLGISHPFWVMDPDFDLDAHIRHHVLPASDQDTVAALIAEIMTPPLDRSRPLWEAHVIEGLADGQWAVVSKYHHATIDGGAGILLAHLLLDTDPDARAVVPETLVPDAEPIPSDRELLSRAGAALAGSPKKLVKLQLKMARHLAARARKEGLDKIAASAASAARSFALGSSLDGGDGLPTRPPPTTPWNTSIGTERVYAFRSLPMADLIALKTAVGGSINDVVMAVCAGGLRRYLLAHDALPEQPLTALVPVSRRTGSEEQPWKNLISVVMATVATDEPDPLQRIRRVQQSMASAKGQLDLAPDDAIDELADLSSAALTSAAVQLAARLRLADRVGGPANLTISNVAGPRAPLYLRGARLSNLTPLSLLTEGVGLNITVLSCGDRFDFGLSACARAVPDLDVLLECILDDIDELFEVTGVEPSVTRPPTTGRRRVPRQKGARS